MSRRQILRAVVGPLMVACLVTACQPEPKRSGVQVVEPGTAPATTAASTAPSQPPAPLTGVPAGTPAVATRPALAVPVRVSPSTTPAGLDAADVVYAEFAESDSLHLTAVFHSREAAKVGPVTEIRPVDIRSVAVLRPFVGYTGGPTGFLAQFKDSKLGGITPDDDDKAFSGDYTSTAALWRAAPKAAAPPTPVLDYATTPGDALAGRDLAPARQLTVSVPGGPPMVWRYDAAKSVWTTRVGKATVAATSVVVLTTEYRTLDVRKPSPRSLPSAKVFGQGAAIAVSGPSGAKGTWRKPGQDLVCNVVDADGGLMHPQPGNAWVVYVSSTAKVTLG
ncbi:DUF3048 domain-containing protein [Micromonospora sp. WMMC241]|uniref:DUF3048 domain-containing protein n=1 Tax=Micromonospora sp. WMMC241 TaxID=3015159 RepID=UPI0022B6F673|nr:DUF3048 domain-containing protein [Micromonospora sp. WMMC241]MCZ7440766.1 DUF3048 domain-containing protein [Micromonospora sp. WMMC241]